jgi:hypothetical protein
MTPTEAMAQLRELTNLALDDMPVDEDEAIDLLTIVYPTMCHDDRRDCWRFGVEMARAEADR